MSNTHSRLLPALGIALITLGGCATTQKRMYTPEEMSSVLDARVSAQTRDEIVIPFEIDDEIRQLARHVTDRATSDRESIFAWLLKAGMSFFSK